MEKIKQFGDWALEHWKNIRGSKLTRTASLVVCCGLGLLFCSLNDFLFEFFLKPIGFTNNGLEVPAIGCFLVILGLMFIWLDRIGSPVQTSKADEHDKMLYQAIFKLIPYQPIDYLLNNLHNHWYNGEDLKPFSELKAFLKSDEANFNSRELTDVFDEFKGCFFELYNLIILNFEPSDKPQDRTYKLLPHLDPDRTGQESDTFRKKKKELNSKIDAYDTIRAAFVEVARERGFVEFDVPPRSYNA